MTDIQKRQFQAGPCSLNTLVGPKGAGREVILLHGASFSAQTWQDLGTLAELAQSGHRPHALDMPGFGETPSCAAEAADILEAYISGHQLQQPVLVGPSRGGRYCLEFIFSRSEMAGALVLVGSVAIAEHTDRFRDITVPCLLVWGSEDTVSPPENARFLDQEIPDSRLRIIEGAPHPCYLEAPEIWHQELLGFLADIG